ncbi:MAG TPA: PASTA domain-containing protein, partial [Candidatus Hydrogenedens sp.]|nr:PASTA domain-containing protein [Candidatus Hydrogenedens sp.]
LGSAVNLWVSTGPCVEYTEVPNVVGIEVDAATAEIASALLGVGAINEECNDIYPAGVVFDQEPDGGNTVEVGSLVSIWVSTGSCPEGEGVVEGTPEGVVEGVVEGTPEGVVEGVVEGTPEGVVEGVVEGTPEGVVEGVVEGTPEGVVEGEGEGTIESAVVPYVIGLTQAQANSDILAAGLTVGDVIETCSADNYPAGIVIGQDPADGGNTAVLGSQVNMVVSCGPCTTVPDVVGEELTSALVTLIGYGLEIGDIINVCDNTAPIGSVLIQDPLSITDGCIDPNTSVIPIDLYVVCGPCYSVTFPYVVGNSESLATSILTGLGYSIDDIVYACDDSVPPGYVIDQYPPSDLNTPPLINTCNLDVDLLVSTGPCK